MKAVMSRNVRDALSDPKGRASLRAAIKAVTASSGSAVSLPVTETVKVNGRSFVLTVDRPRVTR